jgi:SOS response regulatory protein OraA/RecX
MRRSTTVVNEIFNHAVRLLAQRDYTIAELCKKLESRFGQVPHEVIDRLRGNNFLNDRRFAENYVARRQQRGKTRLRLELEARGVPSAIAEEILIETGSLSLRDALQAKMKDSNLRAPLGRRDAARLFRSLARLGYDEDAIREEIEQLHEQ